MHASTPDWISNSEMATILVLHGPNLNLLGSREPELYGRDTLQNINAKLTASASQLGHTLTATQSNHEGALIDRLHESRDDFLIINPAGLTHTSIALRDALLAIAKPFVEVHLSNIHRRESFRHHSYFSDIAIGTITGLGPDGYLLALQYAHSYLTTHSFESIRS
jgi:3-dehydroquinate dehydratase-2